MGFYDIINPMNHKKGDKIRTGTIKRLFEKKCHLSRFEIYDSGKLNILIHK